jgi:hypothetical protein
MKYENLSHAQPERPAHAFHPAWSADLNQTEFYFARSPDEAAGRAHFSHVNQASQSGSDPEPEGYLAAGKV